jgi:hypothetical protein
MWEPKEIRKLDLKLANGEVSGIAQLATGGSDRGYEAQLRGIVEVKDNAVVRFDMVALGEFWGEGSFTRGAPEGRFPLAISFTLADGTDVADRIPPQGSRGWLRGYME